MAVDKSGPTLLMKVLVLLVIVGTIAGGIAAIGVYRTNSRQGAELKDQGVKTDADVVSVREDESYSEIFVSYDPPGDEFLEFAHVQDCEGGRYEEGIETVRVVYLPDDSEVIRLEACESSFDSDVFPGVLGVAMLAFAAFMIVRLRRFWRG